MADNIALKKLRVLFAAILLAVAPGMAIAAQVAEDDSVSVAGQSEIADNTGVVEGLSQETGSAWRLSWGPKAAFHLFLPGDLTSSVDFEGYEFGYGCSVGVNLRFIHKTNWLLQTGFSIGYDNAPIQMVPVVPIYGDAAWPSHSLHQGTMVLPVQAGYIFNYGDDLGFGIMTGVEGSFGFAGALSTPRGERHYDLYGDNGVFRRWNISWVTGFLIELPPTITVSIDGSFGLLNVARQPVFRFKAMNETYVRISMTYWLK